MKRLSHVYSGERYVRSRSIMFGPKVETFCWFNKFYSYVLFILLILILKRICKEFLLDHLSKKINSLQSKKEKEQPTFNLSTSLKIAESTYLQPSPNSSTPGSILNHLWNKSCPIVRVLKIPRSWKCSWLIFNSNIKNWKKISRSIKGMLKLKSSVNIRNMMRQLINWNLLFSFPTKMERIA